MARYQEILGVVTLLMIHSVAGSYFIPYVSEDMELNTYADVALLCIMEGGKLPEPKSSLEFSELKHMAIHGKKVANVFLGIHYSGKKPYYSDGTEFQLEYIPKKCVLCDFVFYSITPSYASPVTVRSHESLRTEITPVCELDDSGSYEIGY